MMRRALIAVCVLVILLPVSGAIVHWAATRRDLAAVPPPGRLVDIGGHQLHLWCTGEGLLTVILESGLGGSSVELGYVQPEVAGFARVCSYDRAGLGYSDPGPSARRARRSARELRELLDRVGIREPVVLVAASFGGFIARVFASEYGDRAAGLVLVDASHEDDNHQIPGMALFVPLLSAIGAFRLMGISFGVPPDALAPQVRELARATNHRTAAHRAAANEIRHIHETVAEVRESRRELAIPVIVISGRRSMDARWERLQRDQVHMSRRSCHVIAEQAGHVVALDEPMVVVDAIRRVIGDVVHRRSGQTPCEGTS
jgi:pimeloyl-ACP methyl ester carboxylesterase